MQIIVMMKILLNCLSFISNNFQGIQNGITFGLNIDYSDIVFKFIVVNKTGHIMNNKHVTMITGYSTYYYVSDGK